jgi:hypothetical protein
MKYSHFLIAFLPVGDAANANAPAGISSTPSATASHFYESAAAAATSSTALSNAIATILHAGKNQNASFTCNK